MRAALVWTCLLAACGGAGPVGNDAGVDAGVDAGAFPNLIDPAFGASAGMTITDFGCGDESALSQTLVKTPTGFVAGGSACKGWALVGYTPDGKPDPAFGTNGVAKLFSGDSSFTRIEHVVARSDGRLLATGTTNAGVAFRQFSATGQEDTAWTAAVKADVDFYFPNELVIALQPDGKVVAAGSRIVARYDLTGTRDSTFGANGRMPLDDVLGKGALFTYVRIRPDGKIVIVGLNAFGASASVVPFVALMTKQGLLDESFGTKGVFELKVPAKTISLVQAATVLTNNQLVLAGATYGDSLATSKAALWKITADGVADATFGVTGRAEGHAPLAASTEFAAIIELPDHTLVAAGAYERKAALPSWYVARFTEAGKHYAAFGADGATVFDVESAGGGASGIVASEAGWVVAGRATLKTTKEFGPVTFGLTRVAP